MRTKTMGWQPEATDNKIAFLFGIVGGIVQFFLNIHLDVDFWSKLLEAAITAAVCGAAGIGGKELYKVARSAIKNYFSNKMKKP